ncbi:zinc-dependent metalloprotease [Streptomyces griseiscabiei]|uniref:Zinc-dependent metalloprotease n=1 Tax=Streptomyces griseiscabiei TaxID=2993540 RepID=A0ABU4LK13_9ACTN|nr:zinc-dependent metalloprotease [Streptomyces griseiscabiei]MBZ3906547.1 zinc-dependent metalloprotease [Streptomyces griseiscabiei]MDX2916162.1 zinc-dependent metalloprotease [Streptomyces griseiscabiei]
MSTIEVLDETGRAPRLADEISTILHTALPTVKAITRMNPPEVIRIRLVSPRVWRTETSAYIERKVSGSFARSVPSEPEKAEARQLQHMYRASMAVSWIMCNARTVTDPAGEPQTLIAPRALHHTGLRHHPGALYRMVVHESVHQVQMATSRGTVVPIPFLPRDLDTPERAVVQLMEGHAEWAAQQTAHRLRDQAPTADGPLRRSFRYRRQDALIRRLARWAVDGAQSLAETETETPAPAPAPAPALVVGNGGLEDIGQALHRDGIRFVEAAVEALGVDTFNRIWHTPDLVPLAGELTAPERWFSRAQA